MKGIRETQTGGFLWNSWPEYRKILQVMEKKLRLGTVTDERECGRHGNKWVVMLSIWYWNRKITLTQKLEFS